MFVLKASCSSASSVSLTVIAVTLNIGKCCQLACNICSWKSVNTFFGQQEGHPACKTEWWGAGVVVCLELGADLHMAQLMPLPLTVFCFGKIQIGFTFLVLAYLGSPGQRAVKWVHVCFISVSLTLLVGRQEERPACKSWVMRFWCGCLSGARCTLFALWSSWCHRIPKLHHLLPRLNQDWFFLFWCWLTQVVLEKMP